MPSYDTVLYMPRHQLFRGPKTIQYVIYTCTHTHTHSNSNCQFHLVYTYWIHAVHKYTIAYQKLNGAAINFVKARLLLTKHINVFVFFAFIYNIELWCTSTFIWLILEHCFRLFIYVYTFLFSYHSSAGENAYFLWVYETAYVRHCIYTKNLFTTTDRTLVGFCLGDNILLFESRYEHHRHFIFIHNKHICRFSLNFMLFMWDGSGLKTINLKINSRLNWNLSFRRELEEMLYILKEKATEKRLTAGIKWKHGINMQGVCSGDARTNSTNHDVNVVFSFSFVQILRYSLHDFNTQEGINKYDKMTLKA